MDSRTDLTSDSAAWSRLLQAAYVRDGHDPNGLYGVLDGLRCLGFRLESWRGGVRLLPNVVYAEDYNDWRGRFLEPHRSALIDLLRQSALAP